MNIKRLMSVAALAATIAAIGLSARGEESPAKGTSGGAQAAESSAAEHEPDRNPMAMDPDLAIFSAIIFLLLLAVLGKFAWPTIAAALDERERKIAENISSAQEQFAAAKNLLAEHEAKLAAAAGDVRAMLDEARRDAEQTRKRIETEGHQAAKEELDRAVREIGRARDAAVQELAVTSANVAIDLARGVVRDEISPERQKQIVRDAMSKLGTATTSSN